MDSISANLVEKIQQKLSDVPEFPNQQQAASLADEKTKSEIRSLEQDREERKKYADLLYSLISFWLIFVAFVIIFIGLKKLAFSENVILSIIGATTVNVLGLFYIVTNYLFYRSSTASDISKIIKEPTGK